MPAGDYDGAGRMPDDLDNMLDGQDFEKDFWNDIPEPDAGNTNTNNAAQLEKDMDEEIKVTKKRKPNPKLDQDRLLSDAGILKLRRIAKTKLKFKGKGYEFSDISRMLNLYQIWLDDLYPKAKFKDGLAMLEKLGHTKRMQVSRRAWIDETKNHRRREDEDVEMRLGDVEGWGQTEDDAIFPVSKENDQSGPRQNTGGGSNEPDEDELNAHMGEQPQATAASPKSTNNAPTKSSGPFQDDDPDEDELDALLNEDSRPNPQAPQAQSIKVQGPFEEDDDDQDELDMLLGEEPQDAQSNDNGNSASGDKQNINSNGPGKEADFADDEEAMAEMGW